MKSGKQKSLGLLCHILLVLPERDGILGSHAGSYSAPERTSQVIYNTRIIFCVDCFASEHREHSQKTRNSLFQLRSNAHFGDTIQQNATRRQPVKMSKLSKSP